MAQHATDLCFTSALDLGRLIRSRELSPVELTDAVLERVERLNPRLNAFLTVTADLAREQAKASEERARRADQLKKTGAVLRSSANSSNGSPTSLIDGSVGSYPWGSAGAVTAILRWVGSGADGHQNKNTFSVVNPFWSRKWRGRLPSSSVLCHSG